MVRKTLTAAERAFRAMSAEGRRDLMTKTPQVPPLAGMTPLGIKRPGVEMSKALRNALHQCSQDAAPDMGRAGGGADATCVAEACFSLVDMNYPVEKKELTALVTLHGYDAVLKEAAKHVGTL